MRARIGKEPLRFLPLKKDPAMDMIDVMGVVIVLTALARLILV
jgi:hypothetical protein